MVLVFGLILLGFTEGGIFNPVIPTQYARPGFPSAGTIKDPQAAYHDLSQSGPLTGILLLAIGAIGLIYGWAAKAPE
jgi:hypothetical protein